MDDKTISSTAVNPKATIARLWGYLKKYKWQLWLITLMVIASTIASVLAPLIMSFAIDDFIGKGNLNGLLWVLLILAMIYVLHSIFTWVMNVVMVTVSEGSLYHLRKDLFEHLQSLSLSFFDQNKKGDLMSRFTNDISIISDALSDAVTQVISSVITLIGVTFIMFIMNPILAITTIITVPFFFILVAYIGKKSGEFYERQQKTVGDVSSYAEEMMSGMKVIKSYGKEEDAIQKFEMKNQQLRDTSIKAEVYANLVMPINLAITNLGQVLLIGVGAYLVLNGGTTIGGILAFLTYSSMFRRPINQLASLYASIQGALAGAERIFEIIDTPVEIIDDPQDREFHDIKGNVTFDHVTFSYVKGKPILKDINLSVKAGENMAIVGPTGAGKTTFINLLSRFYEIDKGKILIDDVDITTVKKSELRKKIGIVLQDTYLFKGTVKENIKYGNRSATDEEIIAASKKAQAHSFIHRLPDGYDSFVEEEGSNFSQGQRQLISIARAILADPEILILDEATSNVDTRTEVAIQDGMKELMKGRTSFVIAHRLSTIRESDCILVMNQGEIIESGTHEELIKQKGFYYQLYMSQFEQ